MKEGISSIDIVSSSEYIDFIGATYDPKIAGETQALKGYIRLVTTKSIKVKSITVKFIGESILFQNKLPNSPNNEISSPILPKLKAKVPHNLVLTMGDHSLPWELDIPNIYPKSFINKRCLIRYRIEIKLSLGLNKSITLSKPIVIKRHSLPSLALSALTKTKTFEKRCSNGFYYYIKIPSIVCIERGYFPISIKYDYLDGSKKRLVKFITSQMTQIELYRCRPISKLEADMANLNKKSSTLSLYDQYKSGDMGVTQLVKVNPSIVTNYIDKNNEDYSIVPLLVHQTMKIPLTHSFDSPLVAVCHLLELSFNFGTHDEVRVKLPIEVSSVPDPDYPSQHHKYTLETELHKFPYSVSSSDMNLPRRSSLDLKSFKHQSIPLTPRSRSNSILFSQTNGTNDSLTDDDRPTSRVSSISSELSSSPTEYIHSTFGSFVGLHPPPRRKKDLRSLPLPPIPVDLSFKRRNNSVDGMIPQEKYCSSVTDHYVRAELPPIPGNVAGSTFTRKHFDERRATRMYYEDDSEDDE